MNSTTPPPNPDEPQRVLITANPYSGSRGNKRHVERLVAALEQRGLQPEMMWDKDGLAPLVASEGFTDQDAKVASLARDSAEPAPDHADTETTAHVN